MPVGTRTVHKDLSLITQVLKWTGTDAAVTLEEFISITECSAHIGRWKEAGEVGIALLKLVCSAKAFYKSCSEIHVDGLTWPKFKTVFRNRYKDVYMGQ